MSFKYVVDLVLENKLGSGLRVFFQCAESIFSILSASLFAALINQLIAKEDITTTFLIWVFVIIGTSVFSETKRYFSIMSANKIGYGLSSKLFEKIINQNFYLFIKEGDKIGANMMAVSGATKTILFVLVNDLIKVSIYVATIIYLVSNSLGIVFTIGFVIAIIFYILISSILFKKCVVSYKSYSLKGTEYSSRVLNVVSNIETVKNFSLEDFETTKIKDKENELLVEVKKYATTILINMGSLNIINRILLILFLGSSIYAYTISIFNEGDIFLFNMITWKVLDILDSVPECYNDVKQALFDLDKVTRLIKEEGEA